MAMVYLGIAKQINVFRNYNTSNYTYHTISSRKPAVVLILW